MNRRCYCCWSTWSLKIFAFSSCWFEDLKEKCLASLQIWAGNRFAWVPGRPWQFLLLTMKWNKIMIHSASSTLSRQERSLFSLEIVLFSRFPKWRSAGRRTTCVKTMITTSRDCWSAEWIEKTMIHSASSSAVAVILDIILKLKFTLFCLTLKRKGNMWTSVTAGWPSGSTNIQYLRDVIQNIKAFKMIIKELFWDLPPIPLAFFASSSQS